MLTKVPVGLRYAMLPLVIANWKMNLALAESVALARSVAKGFATYALVRHVELVLCPTYPALPEVAEVLARSGIALGAQDVFWKNSGPYTGEVSPQVLAELGVRYVIIGHSERRQYLKESEAMVQQKVSAALAVGLTPVLCVGETYAERQNGETDRVVAREVRSALTGTTLPPGSRLAVAYEPVWVIGSGQAVLPAQAAAVARVIQAELSELYAASVARQATRVIYGGSIDLLNVSSFMAEPLISGVLIGGASLDARKFTALLKRF